MRRTLSAADAKNRFADVLRQAERGEPVMITRYRKPVAALIGGETLERLQHGDEVPGEAPATADVTELDARPANPQGAPPTDGDEATHSPRQLCDRAAAGSLRRIEADLARAPERLKPALRLIRANLFYPRLTAERLKDTLRIGAHDFTTEFARVTGSPIYKYLTDRRLETVARLLVDTDLAVQVIAEVAGYSRLETLSRAFKKRYGVRPTIYREFEGQLSPEVAHEADADRPPPLPRYLAGTAAVASGAVCGRCGSELEAGMVPRVFEDLAPICDPCARQRAPELATISSSGDGG